MDCWRAEKKWYSIKYIIFYFKFNFVLFDTFLFKPIDRSTWPYKLVLFSSLIPPSVQWSEELSGRRMHASDSVLVDEDGMR